MINSLLTKIFGTKHERDVKALRPLVEKVGSFEPTMKALSDADLRAKTDEFRRRLAGGETLDDLLPEAFAAVREAGARVLGMRHFDVQLIGGMVLHQGKIAEMKTGEGKTLVATLPVYLNALASQGVHVVTVNDYLARRDADWMGKIYRFLGLSVGVIQHDLDDAERRRAYESDVTYGTNNEFGFDYLRDNMKFERESMVQRHHGFAIVDEVDSILIDEARTPLIISGPSEGSTERYQAANKIVPNLIPGREIVDKHGEKSTEGDYLIDEKSHTAVLTEEGVAHAEKLMGVDNLYDPANMETLHAVQQALRAHTLYKPDVNYVVKDGKVTIVDEFTGRLMPGRRWSDGLHQAVEAKEGVRIEKENQTLATITLQNYFRMYDKLAGMTGTAETEAPEFDKIYELDVVVIPTNRSMIRIDDEDLIYRTEREKFDAVVEEVAACSEKRQPVLVGTVSIEKSEHLSTLLRRRGIKHVVLNAKYHEREAQIVAQAGVPNAVTIATNMAGRGTDIILGGNPEFRSGPILEEVGLSRLEGLGSFFLSAILRNDMTTARRLMADNPVLTEEMVARIVAIRDECRAAHDDVISVGGLRIIGTERHESRRIDNQLRGRAGRQGDPGGSRFYLSLEDDLMRIFGSDRLQGWMQKLGMEEGVPIEHRMVTRSIERAQKQVEGRNFESRKHLLEYDDVMNKQRESIYSLRQDILAGKEGREYVLESARGLLEALLGRFAPAEGRGDTERGGWDSDAVETGLLDLFGMDHPDPSWTSLTREAATTRLSAAVEERYAEREARLGAEVMRVHEKYILLSVVDQQWKDHLLAVDHLKEGIGLRSYGQRDPLVEYKKESFGLFQDMMDRIEEQVVRYLFHFEPRIEVVEAPRPAAEPEAVPVRRGLLPPERKRESFIYDGSSLGGEAGPKSPAKKPAATKVGRNDPCPCGSGKKYKKCHGAPSAAEAAS